MISEISQTKKDKYHVISLTYGIFKKNKNKQTKKQAHRYREQISGRKSRRVEGWKE